MSNNKLAKLLTDTLPSERPTLFNPWRDHCSQDEPWNGPDAKLARLEAHLACDPEFILCGEAAGYQGCRYSGIAFTSERLLWEGKIPRLSPLSQRLTIRRLPYSEPSATTMWKALSGLGIEKRTILWNALPMHPHVKGNEQSNRKPTSDEIEFGKRALRMLVDEFPSAKVVAVGKKGRSIAPLAERPLHSGASSCLRWSERIYARAEITCG